MPMPDGRVLALVTDKRALPEDCARADILITRRDAPPGCAATLILDRAFLAAHGATTIRLPTTGNPVLTTARGTGERVPWRPAAPSIPTPGLPTTHAPSPPASEAEEPEPLSEGPGESLQ
jgi:competence protein ComEC